MNSKLVVGIVLILLSAGMAVGVAAGQGEYTISMSDSTDTIDLPDDEINEQYPSYDITSVGDLTPGESIAVDITAPSNSSYEVRLLNNDGIEQNITVKSGDASVTFEDDLTKGTYAVTVEPIGDDSDVEAVYPIVVSGYTITGDYDTSVESGEILNVDVSIPDGDLKNISQLNIGTQGGEASAQKSIDGGSDTYNVQLDTSGLDSGEYTLYAVAQGEDKIEQTNRNEILAVSKLSAFSVTESQSDDDTGSSGGSDSTESEDTATNDDSAELEPTDSGAPSVSETDVMIGDTVDVTATYRNTGGDDVLEQVKLLQNGTTVNNQEIVATAGGTTSIEFTHTFSESGQHSLSLQSPSLGTESVATISVASTDSSTSDNADTSESTDTDDQPSDSTEESSDGTSSDTSQSNSSAPGFGLAGALVGVLLVTALLGKRHQ